MTFKTLAMTVSMAAGVLSSPSVTAETMSQTVNQSALTSAKHSVLHTRDVYDLQRKASWATRFLSFLGGVGGRERLVLCVSDDHRAIVSQWRVAENDRGLIKQSYVALGGDVGSCQVWYHSGTVASAKVWSLSLPSDVLAIGEASSWFEVGGMVRVKHTLDGTRFVVNRINLAQAKITPDARMLKLFKDK